MPLNVADNAADNSLVADAHDFGYEAEAFPLWAASGTAILGTAGSVYGTAIIVRRSVTVSSLVASVTTAGGTLTAGDCWGMLYNSAGTLIGQTADQTTPWQTAGLQTMALTAKSTGSLNLTPGLYWGAVVATGTTLPTFAKSGAPLLLFQAGIAAASARAAILATSITTTPANITPASNTLVGSQPYWFALL